ncbi:MAG: gamma-glutamyl-gamma-aminobutyrate hydrolase family protein [Verrucomicrobia bacterium]|nr:gamma-glutamyl-gamma-aminobutyrate hydrolase family protein [Verrucomicrobiota bacterium]
MKPLIGITPSAVRMGPSGKYGGFCDVMYSRAIEQAGGVPVALPLTCVRQTLNHFLSFCDGFLLSGGGDLCEASGAYGRRLTPSERKTLSAVDATRDEMEMRLVRGIAEGDIPVLGICRGVQVMNVALGGTLLADIPGHRDGTHGITWTRRLFNCRRVNSSHHQALDRIAPSLTVVARSGDGLVEAVVRPSARFCVGVQFHPERMAGCDGPFKKLVAAARARAAAR